MPGMSGFEVCEAVRADERVRDTRILMLTAKGRDTDMARGIGVGVDAYVTKPFSTRDLMQKVREMLVMKVDRRPRAGHARAGRGPRRFGWRSVACCCGRRSTRRSALRSTPRSAPLLASHGMLPVLWWLIASTLAAWVAHGLYRRTSPRRRGSRTRPRC